jgi:hypothetical protein
MSYLSEGPQSNQQLEKRLIGLYLSNVLFDFV